MTETEPPAVWWDPEVPGWLLVDRGEGRPGEVEVWRASTHAPRRLPADAVRLHSRPECTALCRDVEQDRDALLAEVEHLCATAVPDTGHDRETGADWAARPRRFSPEDTLSVAERLGAAEQSESPDPNHVRNAVANVLLELYGVLPLSVRYRAADEAAKVVAQWQQ